MVVEGSRRSKLTVKIIENSSPIQSAQDGRFAPDLDSWIAKVETSTRPELDKGEIALTERVLLSIITLSRILPKDPAFNDLALAFLIHTVLMEELHISRRRQTWTAMEEDSNMHVIRFLSKFAGVSRRIMREDCWRHTLMSKDVSCDIADLVDGRLFSRVVHQMAEGFKGTKFSPRLASKVAVLTRALYSICGVQLHLDTHGNTSDSVIMATKNLSLQDESSGASVLPFSNRVFDKHLASISISVNHSRQPEGQSARVFREVSHWHNAKRRLDPKTALPVSDREKSRALRKNQFFMAEMQAYAASLTNAAGRSKIR